MTKTKTKKILIAEDEKPMAKALTLKLKNSGFEIIVAHDGNEAMNYIKKENLDLILLDIMMPEKDGFSIMEEMKKKKIKIPVMVLSNLSQESDIKKAENLGALGFFIKSNTPISEIVNDVKKKLSK